MENINQFWLIIHPHVYVSRVGLLDALLYNSQNGYYIEVNNQEIISLIDQLHEEKNLGSILLENDILNTQIIGSFIIEAKMKGICDTVNFQFNSPRPVQLMPILSIQKDIEKLKKQSNAILGDGILNYLTQITLIVNNQCDFKFKFCSDANKQFTYCTSMTETVQSLKLDELKSIATQISQAPINRVNIIGGDLSKYKLMPELFDIFKKYDDIIHLWEYYRTNIIRFKGILDVLVDFPIEIGEFNLMMSKIKIKKTSFHFLITSEDEVSKAEQIIDEYNIIDYQFYPYFNKKNIDFFERNIYMSKDDILGQHIIQRLIFCNQVLNSNRFGQLTVSCNGDVYANVNAIKLGNIKEKKLLDIINDEIVINTSWRVIRDQKPCNECLYQFLCPPPSNYESVIGKGNLCTLISN